MVCYFLLVCGLLVGLVNADMPCEVYDVTTLARPRESPSMAAADGVSTVYEVHSRTNAIGQQTNFEEVTGIKDPLQNSTLTCVDTSDTRSCRGWEFDGFEDASWSVKDSFLDWSNVPVGYINTFDLRNSNSMETVRRAVFGANMEGSVLCKIGSTMLQCLDEYKVRFKLRKSLFFGYRDDGDTYPGVELIAPEKPGESFTFVTTDYRQLQAFDRSRGEEDSGELPVSDVVETAFLTNNDENHQGLTKLSIESISRFSGGSNHSYHVNYPLRADTIRMVPHSPDEDDYKVYKVRYPRAKRLIGTVGSVLTPAIEPEEKICISMKYSANLHEEVQLNVSLAQDGATGGEVLTSMVLTGTGEIESKQFSVLAPPTPGGKLEGNKLRLNFEASSPTSFTVRSFRKCSTRDADILFGLPQHQTKPPLVKGLSLKCPHETLKTARPIRKCLNGGINVEEWCQCLPGFTGPSCEKACPPNSFGADCGALCNPIGDQQCKGIRLAAPGRPLECARGYYGPDCKQACPRKFYGPNCKLECGFCRSGTCDRFSGKCSGPCAPGYIQDNCQEKLLSIDHPPVILNTYSDQVRGYVEFLGPVESYPVLRIEYKKVQESSWTTVFLSMKTRTFFEIDSLESGETYILRALPVHKSGDFSQQEDNRNAGKFSTKCEGDEIRVIKAAIKEGSNDLLVEWKVENPGLWLAPCVRLNYHLEISSPELAEPVIVVAGPSVTQKVVDNVLLTEGSVRVKSVGRTDDGTNWSQYVQFEHAMLEPEEDDLRVMNVSGTDANFLWTGPSGKGLYHVLECFGSPILCDGQRSRAISKRVQGGAFTLSGLSPFTRYSCEIENMPFLAVTFATEPDVPSTASTPPRILFDAPLLSVTNTSAWLEFSDDISCSDLNGAFVALNVELWNGDQLKENFTVERSTRLHVVKDLAPETSYDVKVFVVNMVGRNPDKFASLSFKTKSKVPDAVRDLVIYKRTRSDLWLRWMNPENDHGSVSYRVHLSTPGVPTKTETLSPTQCEIWPDFVCHHVQGLISDAEYTATVEPYWESYRGPSVSTKVLTRESEPDAPENVHIKNYTMHSIMLAWEIPLMLNSNPKFFLVTLDQVDEFSNSEKSTESVQQNIRINEYERFYEYELTDLNPATTYAITVSAGNRGKRAMLNGNTPPKSPQPPPTPVKAENSLTNPLRIIAEGVQKNHTHTDLLSGYLVLLSANSTDNGIFDETLADSLKTQFGEDFIVVEELPPTLDEESIDFSAGSPRKGLLGQVESISLTSGLDYRVAVAAVSTYCGAHSATVSPAVTVSAP